MFKSHNQDSVHGLKQGRRGEERVNKSWRENVIEDEQRKGGARQGERVTVIKEMREKWEGENVNGEVYR